MDAMHREPDAGVALIQRMIARSRDAAMARRRDTALRQAALARLGLDAGDQIATLVVPARRNPLVAVSVARRRRLRRRLIALLRAGVAADTAAAAGGKASSVAGGACASCRGACCGYGGERAYLTEATMARVAAAATAASASRILRRDMDRVPNAVVEGSRIFHGTNSGTLERGLRADVGNRHHCPPLRGFPRHAAAREPRDMLIMAVEAGVPQAARVVTAEEQR